MLLAQTTLPDPNHYASIGWVIVILTGLIVSLRQGMNFVRDLKGREPEPPNSTLGTNVHHLDQRVHKVEEDVSEVRAEAKRDREALEQSARVRSAGIYNKIEQIRTEMTTHTEEIRRELSDKMDAMPDRVIATLKNTGAI